MHDKNLTDNEIIKALECCTTNGASCKDCPAFLKVDRSNCKKYFRGALDLINRLKEEIERLKDISDNKTKELLRYNASIEELHKKIETAKAEAYKECIEKAKKELAPFVVNVSDVCEVLDNLLKELVGENNG